MTAERAEERRKGPRREEERHLHYAREALIGAALAAAASLSDGSPFPPSHPVTVLRVAAGTYLAAEERASTPVERRGLVP